MDFALSISTTPPYWLGWLLRTDCVSPHPRFICWSPNPIWSWAFKRVIKVKRGHEVGALIQKGLVALEKDQISAFLSFSLCVHRGKATWAHREKVAICKPGRDLIRNQSYQNFDLELLVSRTVRKLISVVSAPVCGPWLWQPEWTRQWACYQDLRDPGLSKGIPSPVSGMKWGWWPRGLLSSLLSPFHKQTASFWLAFVSVSEWHLISHLGAWAQSRGEAVTGGPICPWDRRFDPDYTACNFWQYSYLIWTSIFSSIKWEQSQFPQVIWKTMYIKQLTQNYVWISFTTLSSYHVLC